MPFISLSVYCQEAAFVNVPEEQPIFPGCNEPHMNRSEKYDCSQEKLLEFVYTKVRYPHQAKVDSVTGMVVLQFPIDSLGVVGEVKVVRSVREDLDIAAVKAVEQMKSLPPWTPATQWNKPVAILYTLPIKYKLD